VDNEICYRAVLARDPRYDGRFFTAVLTTGIFCRPICPARPPKPENCRFMPTAAAAQAAGFRPCLRCRPELSPHLPGWRGTSVTVSKALRYISEGFLNDRDVPQLADRLGIGERHFRRLFQKHMGTSPQKVSLTRRLLMAKQLLSESRLSITDIAYAAGFQSTRRFNDALRKNFALSPKDIRKKFTAPRPGGTGETSGLTLRLAYSPPFDWRSIIRYLTPRAIPGVEQVTEGGYTRSMQLNGKNGWCRVTPHADRATLKATIHFPDITCIPLILARLRTIFDLDANIAVINDHLSTDPNLAWRIRQNPGIRVIGAWDPFELTVRAILGQQVTVAAATTLIGRIVNRYGAAFDPGATGLSNIFPAPDALARADLSGLGITGGRIRAITTLAQTVADDPDFFDRSKDLDGFVRQMCALPGIGPWTAHYIAMRALREADAFPASDLVLLKRMQKGDKRPTAKQLEIISENWRPWRAYAAMYLWNVEHDDTTDQ